MKLSVLVSSYWLDADKPTVLKGCLNSIENADEVIALVNPFNYRLGYADSWNRLATLATGDFILFMGDNCRIESGNIKDLCVPNAVTSPLLNGVAQDFWGSVFCMPREVYNTIGLYDMDYNNGCHYEDEDLWKRLTKNKIQTMSINTVNVVKNLGGRTIDKIPGNDHKKGINREVFNKKWQ